MTKFRQTTPPESDRGGSPPPEWEPLGWDGDPAPPPPSGRGPDLSALFLLLDALRAMVPRELQDQFTALVRELLLTLRALIDWYVERLDGARGAPRVEEIPID